MFENQINKGNAFAMILEKTGSLTSNEILVNQVLNELRRTDVSEFVICPGGRNTPFITALEESKYFKLYYWPEERSAGFFALGRSKLTGKPVVVCTTSGTAAGELLPVAMDAYYTGTPLILLTADRPRRFRHSGAPQAAEQEGLFGCYTSKAQDLAEGDACRCDLEFWSRQGPAHLNVCLEEPFPQKEEEWPEGYYRTIYADATVDLSVDRFLQKSHYPLVVVSAIPREAREAVARFLLDYNAPVYLEAVSGLREEPKLASLRIHRTDHLWSAAEKADYPIDGVLRIGGVPTFRLWRDLEDKKGHVEVCSLSELSFGGLSGEYAHVVNLQTFFSGYRPNKAANRDCRGWISQDRHYYRNLLELLDLLPSSEAALVHQLSKQIQKDALVYLGNSLPIREWDAFAAPGDKNLHVMANRGLNGIDGQISTFLGSCSPERCNWGLVGDLTAIYDLAAPWILPQISSPDLNLVIINNGGGKIFSRMFPLKQIQNPHTIRFNSLAQLWNMEYETYTKIPDKLPYGEQRLIEIIPDEEETTQFWNRLGKI